MINYKCKICGKAFSTEYIKTEWLEEVKQHEVLHKDD